MHAQLVSIVIVFLFVNILAYNPRLVSIEPNGIEGCNKFDLIEHYIYQTVTPDKTPFYRDFLKLCSMDLLSLNAKKIMPQSSQYCQYTGIANTEGNSQRESSVLSPGGVSNRLYAIAYSGQYTFTDTVYMQDMVSYLKKGYIAKRFCALEGAGPECHFLCRTDSRYFCQNHKFKCHASWIQENTYYRIFSYQRGKCGTFYRLVSKPTCFKRGGCGGTCSKCLTLLNGTGLCQTDITIKITSTIIPSTGKRILHCKVIYQKDLYIEKQLRESQLFIWQWKPRSAAILVDKETLIMHVFDVTAFYCQCGVPGQYIKSFDTAANVDRAASPSLNRPTIMSDVREIFRNKVEVFWGDSLTCISPLPWAAFQAQYEMSWQTNDKRTKEYLEETLARQHKTLIDRVFRSKITFLKKSRPGIYFVFCSIHPKDRSEFIFERLLNHSTYQTHVEINLQELHSFSIIPENRTYLKSGDIIACVASSQLVLTPIMETQNSYGESTVITNPFEIKDGNVKQGGLAISCYIDVAPDVRKVMFKSFIVYSIKPMLTELTIKDFGVSCIREYKLGLSTYIWYVKSAQGMSQIPFVSPRVLMTELEMYWPLNEESAIIGCNITSYFLNDQIYQNCENNFTKAQVVFDFVTLTETKSSIKIVAVQVMVVLFTFLGIFGVVIVMSITQHQGLILNQKRLWWKRQAEIRSHDLTIQNQRSKLHSSDNHH